MMLAKRQQPLATRKCTTKRDLLALAAICDAANQRLALLGNFYATLKAQGTYGYGSELKGMRTAHFGSLFVDFWFQPPKFLGYHFDPYPLGSTTCFILMADSIAPRTTTIQGHCC
jgi:hypothetical protein